MAISQTHFCSLPLPQRAALLWTEGTLLASRWEGSQAVGVYQVGDFYCELHYDTTTYALLRTRLITSVEDLRWYSDCSKRH